MVEQELAADFELRLDPSDTPTTPESLRAALRDADGVLCTVTDRLDASALDVEPLRARILANFGVGHEHIDLAAAARRGLAVTNTPDVLTDATAELALTLMLMVARRAGEGERELRAGRWTGWRPTHLIGRPLTGRTLGIIGMGRIGRTVARRAREGFGMHVLYVTRSPLPPGQVAAEACARIEDLLPRSDFVSLHAPATPETRHLMNAARLALMRPTAYLINSARGSLVDQQALAAALRAGTIAGAGLDVYEREPDVPRELLQLENVVLLPHLGSATDEARTAMGRRAHQNLRAFFAGAAIPDPISPDPNPCSP